MDKLKIYKIFLIIYIIFILYVTLIDDTFGRIGFDFNNIKTLENINLVPFKTIYSQFDMLITKDTTFTNFIINIIGNLTIFIPLGFLVNKLEIKNHFLKLIIFLFVIETSQFIFGCGVFDIDDIILNTLGYLIGQKTSEKFIL